MALHFHLVSVHIPVVLMPLAFILLVMGAWRGRMAYYDALGLSTTTLTTTGRSLILVSAIMAGIAYYTGPIAFESVETQLDAVRDLVEFHAVLGRATFFGIILVAIPTILAVMREFEEEPPSFWLDRIVIVGSGLLCYLLLWTGHLGGAIRRPELVDNLGWLFPIF